MRPRLAALLLAAAVCGGCVSRWPAPADQAVVGGPEDEEPVPGGSICRVVERLELPGEAEVTRPALAGDSSGVTVAWVARSAGDRVLRAQGLDLDLTPRGEPLEVAPGEGLPLWPALARCPGRSWLAWQMQERTRDSLRIAALPADGSAAVDSRELAALGRTPAAACVDGTGVVAYAVRDRGLQDVMVQWLPLGVDAPGAPIRVSGETDSAATPALACAEGRCTVAWSDMREGPPEVYAVAVGRLAAEAPAPVRLSASNRGVSGGGGAYRPALAALSRRRFVAAWHDGRSRGGHEIYAVGWGGGLPIGPDRRISASAAPSTAPALASCGDTSVVAWSDGRAGPPAVTAAAIDRSGRRTSAAACLSDGTEDSSAPVAACAGSRAVIGWVQASGGRGAVRLALVDCSR
jgi:hypothetical protein